jgi:endonuclease YncB( thermonuclease family)
MGNSCLKIKNTDNQMNLPQKDLDILEKCDCKTPLFCISGRKIGKVVKVYDGDTFQIVFKFNKIFQRFKVRCYGYNSHEIKVKKNSHNYQELYELGQRDKKALSDRILNKIVTIDCLKFGKYGRIIAKVYHNGDYINKWMVEYGFGNVYMTEPDYEKVDPIMPDKSADIK